MPALLLGAMPASAAPIADAPITYCGDPDTDPSMDTGAGTMITCVTQITNTVTAIDPISGVASGIAHVKVTECTGPANGRLAPSDLTCTTDEKDLVGLVTNVEQCNGVGYGGGNVLECSVDVTTNFVGVSPQPILPATVNQCNVPQFAGLDKTGCDPYPATATNATITQCNDSSYGGGQEDFNCLATGTTSASLSVTVHQCNNSNYGGGSWLNCSADLSNNVSALPTATPTATPIPTAPPTATPIPTAPPTATPIPTAPPTATPIPTAPPTGTPTTPPTSTPTAPPTGTPQATVTPTPTGTPQATNTPRPTGTPQATSTPTPTGTPQATNTPKPTGTPQATATPTAHATQTPDVIGPAVTPSPELPDTSTGGSPKAPAGVDGTPILLIGLLMLALLTSKVYLDRRAPRVSIE